MDDDLVEAIRDDYENAPLSEAERAMCDYAVKLTRNALDITPETHDGLRACGFSDTAILQITLIAAWFNYINRVADALGVGRERQNPSVPVRN